MMRRLLAALWGALRGHPPAGHPPSQTSRPAADDNPYPAGGPVAPTEPFPVLEGPPEGYRMLQRLGGQVHRALDPEGREVIVNRLWLESDERSAVFQHLQTLRSLRHPFLLDTLACWVAADHWVLVTERADGDLPGWLRRCRNVGQAGIPAGPLLRYLGEAAQALDYLRARGLRHPDLRPSNLLRRGGHARVADFMPRPPLPSRLATATFVGTPAYMSPEDYRGAPGVASNQYALAIIYFQMRTGQLPFHGPGVIEQLMLRLQGEPDLGGVPEAEREVLRRALAREPGQRYAGCVELVWQLQRAVLGGCAPPCAGRPGLDPAWLGWNDGCVTKLARTIDEEGRNQDLPVLADALEEAGCTDREILGHLRGPGPHVRECWILDIILAKDR